MIGQALGHYRIKRKIGQGGMGVVYQAWDERLERDVAVKVVLAGSLTSEAARKHFHTEALALSRLNHPNIATVHDFDSQKSIDFLVMEYVEGKTLAEHIAQTAIPESLVLKLAAQLADGLAAAHSVGVIHRDLKPGNVRLTPDGRLKILDFGLARVLRPATDSAPTESLINAQGLYGTIPYIAPEVLAGRPADSRADLYSAGAVVYEMATGCRLYHEVENPRLIYATLNQPPRAPREVSGQISPGLERIILKALEKDPDRRYQTAGDLRLDLERLSALQVPVHARRRRLRGRAWIWSGAVAALAAISVLAILSRNFGRSELLEPIMIPIATWKDHVMDSRLSPDGQWISYIAPHAGAFSILRRSLRGGEPTIIASSPGGMESHVWSEGSDEVAIIAYAGAETFLQIVPAQGAPVRKSIRLATRYRHARLIRWFGSRLYFELPASGLWKLDLGTERIKQVMGFEGEGGNQYEFDVCEDEEQVTFTRKQGSRLSIWVASLGGSERPSPIQRDEDGFRARWMGPRCSFVVYSSKRAGQMDLWRTPHKGQSRERITFSSHAEIVEDTTPDGSILTFTEGEDLSNLWILDPVRGERWQLTASSQGDYFPSASGDGRTIVYQQAKRAPLYLPNLLDCEILVATLLGNSLGPAKPQATEGGMVKVSPEGARLAFVKISRQRGQELWLEEIRTGHITKVGDHFSVPRAYGFPPDNVDTNLAWSPDGRWLFWVAQSQGAVSEIHRYSATPEGARDERLVVDRPPGALSDLHLSPDGKILAYVWTGREPQEGAEVRTLDLETGKDGVLMSRKEMEMGDLLVRGWFRDGGSLLALRTYPNADWSDRAELFRVSRAGREELLGVVDHAYGGMGRLDAVRERFFVTKSEELSGPHNLYVFDIRKRELQRLTSNALPGVSFSGSEVLPDGRILYTQAERNRNVWLIRFQH